MAKQGNVIKLEGTIGGLSFYKSQDGYMAREKGGVSGNRIKKDAAFARTRENGQEFGSACKAGKLLRAAFRSNIQDCSDNRMISRLVQSMMQVVKSDPVSARGERNVIKGNLGLLEGFDFNINGILLTTCSVQYVSTIDRTTGLLKVTVPAFIPSKGIVIPDGASHMKMVSAGAWIDFEKGTFQVVSSESGDIKVDSTEAVSVDLENQLPANLTLPLFLIFGIKFYQLVNGSKYMLNGLNYDTLNLVKVLAV